MCNGCIKCIAFCLKMYKSCVGLHCVSLGKCKMTLICPQPPQVFSRNMETFLANYEANKFLQGPHGQLRRRSLGSDEARFRHGRVDV